MKALIVSDVHLHYSNMDLVENLVDELLNNTDYKNLFILGDWFHKATNNSIEVLNFSKYLFEKLSKQFNIYMLAGNHDLTKRQIDKRQSPLSLYSNYFKLLVINEPKIVDNIAFIPFTSKQEQWDNWIDNLPETVTVIMAHQFFKATDTNHLYIWYPFKQQRDANLPYGDAIEVSSDIPIITGHIHIPYNLGSILYLGSPYPIKSNEGNNHYYFKFNNNPFSLEPITLNLLNYVRVKELNPEYNKSNYIVYANIDKSEYEIREFYNKARAVYIEKISSVITSTKKLELTTAKKVILDFIDNSEYRQEVKDKVKELIFGG